MQVVKGGLPRELKRTWLALIDKLGHGAFGDVWKGLIKDGDNPTVPEYVQSNGGFKNSKRAVFFILSAPPHVRRMGCPCGEENETNLAAI